MITVDQALARGRLAVVVPVYTITIGLAGLAIFLSMKGLMSYYWVPVVLLLAPVAGWLYWGFAITYWRIWAFSHVDDVSELQVRAIYDKLIWPEGHILEQTEIRTPRNRRIIGMFAKRLEEPGKISPIADDPAVPEETRIFRGKRMITIATAVSSVLGVTFIVYLISKSDQFLTGVIFIMFLGHFMIRDLRRAMRMEPEITVNEKGLSIKEEYFGWRVINNVDITYSSNMWLTLETNHGTINTTIDGIDIPIGELRRRLDIYRLRFQRASTQA